MRRVDHAVIKDNAASVDIRAVSQRVHPFHHSWCAGYEKKLVSNGSAEFAQMQGSGSDQKREGTWKGVGTKNSLDSIGMAGASPRARGQVHSLDGEQERVNNARHGLQNVAVLADQRHLLHPLLRGRFAFLQEVGKGGGRVGGSVRI